MAAFLADLSWVGWPRVIGSILLIACTRTFFGLFIPIARVPVFLRPLSYLLPLWAGVWPLRESG